MKLRRIESRFVIGPSNILFAGMYVVLFSLEILQAGAVKGLSMIEHGHHIIMYGSPLCARLCAKFASSKHWT